MQSFFESELGKLKKRIIKMFSLVDMQLDKSAQSLIIQDLEYVDAALQNENRIDKLDLKIDKLCQKILALAQPVATDLRFILSSLRIGNEIERIGDISLDIIGRADAVRAYSAILEEYKVHEIMADVVKMNRNAIEAYVNNNTDLAKEVLSSGKQTADQCKNLFNEIITSMAEKTEVITIATDLILIIRDIERIAGHLTNIAENIVFIVDGIRLRHSGLRAKEEGTGGF